MDLNKYVNLTPHTINVVSTEGMVSIPPTGEVLRLTEKNFPVFSPDFLVSKKIYSFDEEIAFDGDHIYIVSVIMLTFLKPFAHKGITFYAPDTGVNSVVRDEKGRIVAVRAFITI